MSYERPQGDLGDPLGMSMWCPWPKAHHSGLTRRNVPTPHRLRAKRKNAAWNDRYMLRLLAE
jgi:hypothetical protein